MLLLIFTTVPHWNGKLSGSSIVNLKVVTYTSIDIQICKKNSVSFSREKKNQTIVKHTTHHNLKKDVNKINSISKRGNKTNIPPNASN